jgi:hypothetical protein
MSEADVGGAPYASFTSDGLTVASNDETAEDIRANLESEEKPKDGDPSDPEQEEADRVSRAAAELGRKGGKAAAEKRAAAPDKAEAEAEIDEGEPRAEKPLGKPRDDPRARMLEATRKESEAKRALADERRERERLAAEVRELRARVEAPPAPAPSAGRGLPGRPKPTEDEFDNYGDFVDARARYAMQEEFETRSRAAEEQSQANARLQEIGSAVTAFRARLAEAKRADPEFADKLSPDLTNLQPTFTLAPGQSVGSHNIIADEIVSSEHAPDLMLHLTEHPDDLQRIAALSNSREIAREMAKLEARLDAATSGTSSRRETSKAKPPVRPVTGSPTTANPEDMDDDTPFETHVRRMNARDGHRRVAGR